MALFTTSLGCECNREGDKGQSNYKGENLFYSLHHATFLPKIC